MIYIVKEKYNSMDNKNHECNEEEMINTLIIKIADEYNKRILA